jgi:hypothetical protein
MGPEPARRLGVELVRDVGPEAVRDTGPEPARHAGLEPARDICPEQVRRTGLEAVRVAEAEAAGVAITVSAPMSAKAETLARRAMTEDVALRPLPAAAESLLSDLQASPRLVAHLRTVHDVACELVAWAERRHPSVAVDQAAGVHGAGRRAGPDRVGRRCAAGVPVELSGRGVTPLILLTSRSGHFRPAGVP